MPSLLFERFYLNFPVGLYTQNLENNMHVICLSILVADFFSGICCHAGSMKGWENGGNTGKRIGIWIIALGRVEVHAPI